MFDELQVYDAIFVCHGVEIVDKAIVIKTTPTRVTAKSLLRQEIFTFLKKDGKFYGKTSFHPFYKIRPYSKELEEKYLKGGDKPDPVDYSLIPLDRQDLVRILLEKILKDAPKVLRRPAIDWRPQVSCDQYDWKDPENLDKAILWRFHQGETICCLSLEETLECLQLYGYLPAKTVRPNKARVQINWVSRKDCHKAIAYMDSLIKERILNVESFQVVTIFVGFSAYSFGVAGEITTQLDFNIKDSRLDLFRLEDATAAYLISLSNQLDEVVLKQL